MDNEQREKEEKKVVKGNMAEQLFNNPLYLEIIDKRKADIFNDFCKTKAEDSEGRSEAWRTMQNMIGIESNLIEIIKDGRMSKDTLDLYKKE